MTLYREVLTRLGLDICAGLYPPGRVIPAEPILCARLGVSRVVLREAIKGLVSKGMVETRRRTGTIVLEPARWSLLDPQIVTWRAEATGIDLALANDILELRRIVEPAAARLAAERASGAERQALRSAYDAMVRAVAGDGNYVAADLDFHAVIIRACANPFVTQLQGVISTILRIGFERVAETPGGPERSLPLHRDVCEAIEKRDGLEAERAVLALLGQAEVDLRERLRVQPRLPIMPRPEALPAGAASQTHVLRAHPEHAVTRINYREERHAKAIPP